MSPGHNGGGPGASFGADVVIDDIPNPESEDERKRRRKQADLLVATVRRENLFLAPDGTIYADIIVNGHRETWAVRSTSFRRWLTHRYAEHYETAPNTDAVNAAIGLFEGYGQYQAKAREREVHLRVASFEDRIFIDLCDKRWRVVEVAATGWRIISRPPIRFRRPRGMLPLPAPMSGGDINQLSEFLNVATADDLVLVVADVTAALADRGPFVILVMQGEPGAAKSTGSKVVRRLVDPNAALARRLPRDEQALSIAINNGFFLLYENISSLPPWLSDAFASVATGSGYSTRELYTNAGEQLFSGMRPIILNGIENVANRADLADRAVYLQLQPIKKRREERTFWAAFDVAQPKIFGALLDAVAHGLKTQANVSRDDLPRMADFAVWGQAVEGALWTSGTFLRAFQQNQKDAIETVIDADAVASAIVKFMARVEQVRAGKWEGNASNLLPLLTAEVDKRVAEDKTWPKGGRGLSGRLRRAAPLLRKSGIDITFPDAHGQRSAAQRTFSIKTSFTRAGNGASPNGADPMSNSPEPSPGGWERSL